MVQAFPADGSNYTFDERVLPRRSWCDEDFANVHSHESLSKFVPIESIAIAQEISRGAVEREGLDDLLCRPERSWMGRDVKVKDPPTVVSQDNENEGW